MTKYGFDLVKAFEIPELNTKGQLFVHVKTGARLLSLDNEDENKVFGITFRTPPPDSTGLPHIMEHSVLCGSRKYPVKEPFVELMKGSLNTFLNAMTFPDKTCYPVASQNVQDFYNLVDVYMDAVLYPLIPPETLEQEGWHYELDAVDDPLVYKGVVFNEMKGAYSSPDTLLNKHSQESLFPGHVYGLDSGGDPRQIPNLTYEQFKKFHEKYYHPSNSFIYFYGDDNPDERLRRMDEYLQAFERVEVDSSISLQPPFEKPVKAEVGFDPGEGDDARKNAQLVVNWVLGEATDRDLNLSLTVLAFILIGTPASPLRKALIDSGLGDDLAGFGFEPEMRQLLFSTGLKGIAEEDASKVESLVLDTLRTLVDQGIEEDMIAAAMNTIEFRLRENNTGSFPQGLLLMLRALTTWLHDEDPVAMLAFEKPLSNLKHRLKAEPRYFEHLIVTHFLNNLHRSTLLLKPEPGLTRRLEAEEQENLAVVRQTMSDKDLLEVQKQTRALKARQETPDSAEALATIPSLILADLERNVKTIPNEITKQHEAEILYHDIFTNGIVYLDLGFDLHQIKQEHLPYATLFGRALLEMGTESQDFVKLSQRIGRTTGGIRPASFISAVRAQNQSAARLFLRGKATLEQSQDLLDVLLDILTTARLDNRDRFKQIVLEEKADQEAALVPAGHRVVNTRLRARFDEAGWVNEQVSGVSYLFFLRQLVDEIDRNWAGVVDRLETMRRSLISTSSLICNVTLDEENWTTFKSKLDTFLANLPQLTDGKNKWAPQYPTVDEGLVIPAQVNYVGKGENLFRLGYELDGSINVITNYLRSTYLWERVRVQGGAYGGFCAFDPRSGVFTYLSYRDPNLLETIQNYDGTPEFLKHLDAGRLSAEELTKSIIGAIGELDAYQLPDAKGYTSMLRHLLGETDEYRQKIRDEVLSTSLEDFQMFGEILAEVAARGKVVVLGNQGKLEEANQAKRDWLSIQKVL
jgi:presequence protease